RRRKVSYSKNFPGIIGNNPGYIIGDSAYPCLECLIVPFRDNGHLTNAQKRFNTRLSQCRVTVQHAFRILIQRFRKMYYLNIRKRETAKTDICMLHSTQFGKRRRACVFRTTATRGC
ncbi:hypothetical protein NQ314_012767, partial [Rhamnusium bicolor]